MKFEVQRQPENALPEAIPILTTWYRDTGQCIQHIDEEEYWSRAVKIF